MTIGVDDINKIVNDGKKMGHDIRVGDIAYSILLNAFGDKKISFAVLFGKDSTPAQIDGYENSKKVKFLKKYMRTNFFDKKSTTDKKEDSKSKNYDDITFGENKEQLIKNLATIKQMKDDGELDAKDFIKLDIDIRTKLIDKFSVSEKQEDQRVMVYKKFNDICACGREIYRPTKEDIIEELQKDYNLVPKVKPN